MRKESRDMKYKITMTAIEEITDEERAELSAEYLTREAIEKYWTKELNNHYPNLRPATVKVETVES
jgi:hypothetical protein